MTFAACTDVLDNPARRVLVFQGYPVEVVSKCRLIQKFRTLCGGSSFRACTILRFDIFPETGEAYLLFSAVSVAVGIMKFYKLGLLGDEFRDCRVLFGKDPSDRPVPGNKINGIVPAAILEPLLAKLIVKLRHRRSFWICVIMRCSPNLAQITGYKPGREMCGGRRSIIE